MLRRKGSIKVGGSLDRPIIDSKSACARCCLVFGYINRGAECNLCHLRVCRECRIDVPFSKNDWVCIICFKEMWVNSSTNGNWMMMIMTTVMGGDTSSNWSRLNQCVNYYHCGNVNALHRLLCSSVLFFFLNLVWCHNCSGFNFAFYCLCRFCRLSEILLLRCRHLQNNTITSNSYGRSKGLKLYGKYRMKQLIITAHQKWQCSCRLFVLSTSIQLECIHTSSIASNNYCS